MHELFFLSLDFFCLWVKRRVHCTHSQISAISEWLYCAISGVFLPTWLLCSWIEALQMLKPRFLLQPFIWVIMIPHHCVNLHLGILSTWSLFLRNYKPYAWKSSSWSNGYCHSVNFYFYFYFHWSFWFPPFDCFGIWVCDSKSLTYLSLFLICGLLVTYWLPSYVSVVWTSMPIRINISTWSLPWDMITMQCLGSSKEKSIKLLLV